MEFIAVEQFQEQPEEVQKVFLDWWKSNISEVDLIGYIGKSKAYEECFPSLVRNINIKCFEIGIEIIPLFTEGQIRRFIEDKTNTKIETSLTVYKQYALWLVKVKGEDYRTFDTREEDLLQAYWKVACMIVKEEVDDENKDIDKITNNFNEWAYCTGFVIPQTSYYYEILNMLYDAYERGLNNK